MDLFGFLDPSVCEGRGPRASVDNVQESSLGPADMGRTFFCSGWGGGGLVKKQDSFSPLKPLFGSPENPGLLSAPDLWETAGETVAIQIQKTVLKSVVSLCI